jgi:hypothetical protein
LARQVGESRFFVQLDGFDQRRHLPGERGGHPRESRLFIKGKKILVFFPEILARVDSSIESFFASAHGIGETID